MVECVSGGTSDYMGVGVGMGVGVDGWMDGWGCGCGCYLEHEVHDNESLATNSTVFRGEK